MLLTKFAEDLLLFVPSGEKDFGVEALGLEAVPGRGLGAGLVPGVNLDVQIDLEQVGVLLLDVTGIKVVPGRTSGQRGKAERFKSDESQWPCWVSSGASVNLVGPTWQT